MLFKKLQAAFLRLKKPWEIIFVDDGSYDGSGKILEELSKQGSEVKVISFSRNFGQTAAFAAGIEKARGKILITLDADLQNDPKDIGKMYELMIREKADVVAGWRKQRNDPFLRVAVSRIANWVIKNSMHSEFHDLGCSLRLYKREALSQIRLYGEMHRFIPVLAAAQGAKVVEMPVSHFPRRFGKSKYGLIRTFKVLLDLLTVKFLTEFQTKPIYLFGLAGFTFVFLSILAGLWVIIRRVLLGGDWVSPMLFIMTILFNVGVLCILMGLLAEIQIRTWYESSGKKGYLIKKII